MIRRPPRSTLFPTRRSSDLLLFSNTKVVTAAGVWTLVEDGALTFSEDRKSTRLNSSHVEISYAVFCLKKKTRFATRCRLYTQGQPRSTTRPSTLLDVCRHNE